MFPNQISNSKIEEKHCDFGTELILSKKKKWHSNSPKEPWFSDVIYKFYQIIFEEMQKYFKYDIPDLVLHTTILGAALSHG